MPNFQRVFHAKTADLVAIYVYLRIFAVGGHPAAIDPGGHIE